jgi:dTDP-glucose pyrophosphorylase/CBS domain-containing protein
MKESLSEICVTADTPIRQVIACMNKGQKGIVLVTDENDRLVGTIVDGDIRRAILGGQDLFGPISSILHMKELAGQKGPVTAPFGSDANKLVKLMASQHVRQLPLVDEAGRPVDLVTISDLLTQEEPRLQAMIMAGGFGKRLHPLTLDCPKPMLPVGGQPLLSMIITRLKEAGISKVNLSTHYLHDQIKEYFGNGSEHGVELRYLTEDKPLGTAGALGLLDAQDQPLLIINGDILTQVDFRSMLEFHRENESLLTVGVRKYEMKVPFGVVDTQGVDIQGLIEKPTYEVFVNAGIYLLEPKACDLVQEDERLDMTDLIQRLLAKGDKVVSFPIIEYWLDVGNPDDYQRAQEDLQNGRWPE